MYVVPFAIAELGHRGLEPAATLKYEPLNSCITVLSISTMKIFKCYASKHLKDDPIVNNQNGSLDKVPLFDI